MKCPLCNNTLQRRDLTQEGFVTVDHCPSCRGCWLEKPELERAHSGVWTNLEDMGVTVAETFSDYLCPQCAARLISVNPEDHPELQVDRCPSCHGVWLDPGELEKLRDAVVEFAEEHGMLSERPVDWSVVRWTAYRIAQQWKHLRAS